ncbi:oligosaccharide flippase family protein [Paenibacillus sp. sgz500958]|uniref:putative polysaccharide biosynthesis protein n=1 Tax=Paenibacillus sp. sgz500958 TaxID=3242475 RepID=UPI0036D3C166
MKPRTPNSKLLEGAFILSAAAIISKLIGTLQKIPLQNLGGDAVFGIYNTVYPIYTLIVTVTMLGLPAAVSRYVAEAEAGGQGEEGQRIVLKSALITGISGLFMALATYAGAPLIARWVGSSHIVDALRTAAWGLAVVPIMTVLRGYFQGLHNMVPTALSQIVEQTVRVAVMISLLLYLSSIAAGPESIAAGAMLGSAGGGAAGLVIMLLYWRRHRRSRITGRAAEQAGGSGAEHIILEGTRHPDKSKISGAVEGSKRTEESKSKEESSTSTAAEGSRRLTGSTTTRQLLSYGVPVMLGALALPLMGLVDVFTLPRLLSSAEGSGREAMVQFGIYNRGLPLVQLVTMLATSLSVVFIPSLAEARFKGDTKLIELRCLLSLRWFWLLGLAASAGLAVLAGPINSALYGSMDGTATIAWVAFTAAGGTVSIISAAMLQGLGAARAPALHLLAAAALKAALNLLLVPQQGITGAAIAGVAAYLFAAALNVLLLRRKAHLRLRPADVLARPALLTAALALAAAAASRGTGWAFAAAGLDGRAASLAQSLLGVAAGCAAFAVGAVALRLLSESELRQLPGIGPSLADLLRKLGLFR